MTSHFRFVTVAVASVSLGLIASARAAVTPLAGIGYNTDVIADNTSTTALVSPTGIDGQFAYFQAGYTGLTQTGSNPNGGGGLPVNLSTPAVFTSLANSNTQFALQGAAGNNALIFTGGNGTGTFTLATPTRVSTLSFIVTGLNGGQADTYTLNYANGTTGTGTFTAGDNFNGANVAISAAGRVQLSNNSVQLTATNPNLYEVDVTSGIVPTAALSSITFTDTQPTAGSGGSLIQTALFGVSATVVPEPASIGLLATVGAGLLARRRPTR